MLCRCGFGSGGGFEGDPVAHGGQLGDVSTHPAFDVDAAGVVIGSEFAEAGSGVVEQVPDDDQDGAGDRDQGLEFAAAFDDAPVQRSPRKVSVLAAAAAASPSAPFT